MLTPDLAVSKPSGFRGAGNVHGSGLLRTTLEPDPGNTRGLSLPQTLSE